MFIDVSNFKIHLLDKSAVHIPKAEFQKRGSVSIDMNLYTPVNNIIINTLNRFILPFYVFIYILLLSLLGCLLFMRQRTKLVTYERILSIDMDGCP